MNINLQSLMMRRLLILLALVFVALVPLAFRLSALTLWHGTEHLREARDRMERRQWLPTVRGKLLDRKGRVLAEDRPTYDVALDFRVISGEWARTQSRLSARRLAGSAWYDMTREQRTQLAEDLRPGFERHVENSWDRLAATLGISRPELDLKLEEVRDRVDTRQRSVEQRAFQAEVDRLREQGDEPDDTMLARLRARAGQPIAEQRSPHVIAVRVGDELGFTCQSLAGETVEAVVTAPAGSLAEKMSEHTQQTEELPAVPGLVVLDAADRAYPMDVQTIEVSRDSFPTPAQGHPLTIEVFGVASHLLGAMRDGVHASAANKDGSIEAGDREERAAFLKEHPDRAAAATMDDGTDRGAYWDSDRVGDRGIEASQEQELRGLRGLALTHLESGEKSLLAPAPGNDVTLTLDAALQARVQAIMDPRAGLAVAQPWQYSRASEQLPTGTALNGAVVVLDIDSGEILAAVTTPSLPRSRDAEVVQQLLKDEVNRPFINRAIGAEYPPGSIIKPVIFCGAAQRGAASIDEHIACNGHLYDNNPNQLQCLIYKVNHITHSEKLGHDPSCVEAIGLSCNIYFYTLGRRLGPVGMRQVLEEFRVTQRWNLGAGYEAPGRIGGKEDLTPFDATLMGIGQGPVTWSPLHAASAFSTIARAGVYIPPHIVKNDPAAQAGRVDLLLNKAAVARALEGLDYVANHTFGTGRTLQIDPQDPESKEPIFNTPGVHIWGKTGTAEAPDLVVDHDGKGPMTPITVRSGDHSWFVLLAGEDRPRYAVAVIIEYGGSGAKVSGPIANQVVHALSLEGYFRAGGQAGGAQ